MPGKDTVLLTAEALSVDFATEAVRSPAAGGISIFVGTTRDNFNGKKVTLLEYEAYEPMAVKEMRELCARARLKWTETIGVAMLHRLGPVAIEEASVIIAVSSPHRVDAIGTFTYRTTVQHHSYHAVPYA